MLTHTNTHAHTHAHTLTHTHCGPMLAGRHAADTRCLHVVRYADTHTRTHTHPTVAPCLQGGTLPTHVACMYGRPDGEESEQGV